MGVGDNTMAKSTSVDDVQLEASFQSVRKTLLEKGRTDRLAKPLGYWVLPNDRRLPLAFLNRTLNDLLSTPYQELTSTPGIGQKKISSLVKLLLRATVDELDAVALRVLPLAVAALARLLRRPVDQDGATVAAGELAHHLAQ